MYRCAAVQEYARAQNNLGVMYYHGNGIKQDFDEAFKWYRCAAEQGHAKAPNSLGVMYYTGGWCAARLRKLVAAGSRAR